MTTNNPERAIENILVLSLARVLEFLKYAEAKNGALLTFASAWILALLALLTSDKELPRQIVVACQVALPFFGVGAGISLCSFFPRLSLERFTRLHSTRHKPNLVYFGDVAELAIDDFERQIRLRYSPAAGSEVSAEYISDMAVQVRINSSIVQRKLRLFTAGLLVVGGGITIVFLPLIAFSVRQFSENYMGLRDFRDDVADEISTILDPSFSIEVTQTTSVPHSDDPAITFPDLDERTQGTKLLETCVPDMRRSTHLSLKHRQPTVAKLYSSFVRAMTRCASYYGGEVRGIIGDRIMVIFEPDDCFTKAVDTAILMNSVCQHVLNKYFTHGEVTFGIGIDYGRMLATKTGNGVTGVHNRVIEASCG